MTDKNVTAALDVPEPPWRRQSKKARRQVLDRERIVEVALQIVDEDGIDGLSMRRIAEELDTGAASLYAHVSGKEELLDLVLDRVIGEIELPEPDPARWQEQVKEWAREGRRVLKAHRDVARVSLGRIPTGVNVLRSAEWLIGLLRAAGLPDRVVAYAGDLGALLVGAYVFEESVEEANSDPEMYAMVADYMLNLPSEMFPNIAAMGPALFEGGPDERFDFLIDVFVAGLAAVAGRDQTA
ncbi:MAG TPA: TetR/AcrR family transcriptional regulator [Acidimicrobiia bacterium]|jgi:AcrR family transcriptional regulator